MQPHRDLELLTKPDVMVKVVLNEFLHILIDAARDIRGNPVNPRLQLRGKCTSMVASLLLSGGTRFSF
jgi:hypothetical protein